MLGRKKSTSSAKPKPRLFFSVKSVADAEEAIKLSVRFFYALAAIQAVIMIVVSYLGGAGFENLTDPVLIVALAWFIGNRNSRTAAVMIGTYSVIIALLTLGNRAGMQLGSMGGRNIVLAIFALFAAYKAIQGTFRFHKMSETRVIWKNVIRMLLLLVVYNVLLFVVLFFVSLLPQLDPLIWGVGEDAFSEEGVGAVLILFVILAGIAVALRVLPFTRNAPLVSTKNEESA